RPDRDVLEQAQPQPPRRRADRPRSEPGGGDRLDRDGRRRRHGGAGSPGPGGGPRSGAPDHGGRLSGVDRRTSDRSGVKLDGPRADRGIDVRRLRPLLPLVVLAALLSAFVAGCGGATGKAGSGPALAPADATMFLTVDTDASSPQLRRAIGLLMRFPSGGKLLDKALLKGAGSMNVDDLA